MDLGGFGPLTLLDSFEKMDGKTNPDKVHAFVFLLSLWKNVAPVISHRERKKLHLVIKVNISLAGLKDSSRIWLLFA